MTQEKETEEYIVTRDLGERDRERIRLRQLAEKGGFAEACIRVMTAVAGRDKVVDVREFQAVEQVFQDHATLKVLTPGEFKLIAREQANILSVAPQQAIKALRKMTLSQQERLELIRIAETIAQADGKVIGKKDEKFISSLRKVLQ